jgi:hypothetical protein
MARVPAAHTTKWFFHTSRKRQFRIFNTAWIWCVPSKCCQSFSRSYHGFAIWENSQSRNVAVWVNHDVPWAGVAVRKVTYQSVGAGWGGSYHHGMRVQVVYITCIDAFATSLVGALSVLLPSSGSRRRGEPSATQYKLLRRCLGWRIVRIWAMRS